jgi:ribosomal protein S18 acetylase RimI-like enzyme
MRTPLIIPKHRNYGCGKEVMQFLYEEAKKVGCKELLSYVDKEGKPLSFYKREGFEILGTVKEYLEANKMDKIDKNDFEDENDYVIKKLL